MKASVCLTVSLLALAVATASSPANAAIINYNGSDVNMGAVAYGQTGVITNFYSVPTGNLGITPPPYIVTGNVFGTLPVLSKITFTYTLPGNPPLLGGTLTSNGSYGPNTYNGAYGYGSYYGNSSANTSTPGTSDHGYLDGTPSLPLVWATANLAGTHGITGIQNNNTNMAVTTTFASLFSGAFDTLPTGGTLSYAVSAIPLPATLPMFASIIGAMFGFRRLQRRNNNIAATA